MKSVQYYRNIEIFFSELNERESLSFITLYIKRNLTLEETAKELFKIEK